MNGARSTGVVQKVGMVLRGLSAREPGGATTTEVARAVDLPRATTHRLLSALSVEGLVDRDHATGRWRLGPEAYLLGAASAARYDVSEESRRVVRQLAAATGESAFFSVVRGDETVCLVREDGSFPLRSHVLHEGIRLPLGVASAGLAILAHLPDREVDEYVECADLVPQWGAAHSAEALRGRVEQTRLAGYATNPGLIVEGSWGLGAAIFDRRGRPGWALSLTGVSTRFGEDRRPELGALLLESAHRVSRAGMPSGSRGG